MGRPGIVLVWPQEAQENRLFGLLEADTITGRNHQGAILTLHGPASGFLWIQRLERRTGDAVPHAALALLMGARGGLRTITGGNGKGFADHRRIAEEMRVAGSGCLAGLASMPIGTPVARATGAGANENPNGLVGQYIPRITDPNTIDDEHIQSVADSINRRPRKRFGCRGPNYVREE